jgi:hypothetical protein
VPKLRRSVSTTSVDVAMPMPLPPPRSLPSRLMMLPLLMLRQLVLQSTSNVAWTRHSRLRVRKSADVVWRICARLLLLFLLRLLLHPLLTQLRVRCACCTRAFSSCRSHVAGSDDASVLLARAKAKAAKAALELAMAEAAVAEQEARDVEIKVRPCDDAIARDATCVRACVCRRSASANVCSQSNARRRKMIWYAHAHISMFALTHRPLPVAEAACACAD